MARIALTGAAGSVGRVTLVAFAESDHEVTPITHRERDLDSVVLEIQDRAAVVEALADHDVVVHLAGDPSPDASWESVLDANIDGTQSVFEAAIENGLDRVVFASTNHTQQMYNVADPERPGSLIDRPEAVYPEDPPRPDSFYAVSKVAGEALGSYYADRHSLEVVNARIGWLLTAEELREKQDADPGLAKYARAMWLSPRDWRAFVRRAIEADLVRNSLTVNATSANAEHYLSLTTARRALDYRPQDDSADAVDGE
jgi:L-arabinose 1-dehydrogenase [NAD(P)+]